MQILKIINELVSNNIEYQKKILLDNIKFKEMLKKEFLIDCLHELKIKKLPKIIFTKNKSKTETLGHNDLINNEIVIFCKNRLISDVFRTLAHELKHSEQFSTGEVTLENANIAGKTGSPQENSATNFGGIMLRNFGKKYPEIYELSFDNQIDETLGNIDKYNDLVKRRYPSPSPDSRVQDNREKDFDATVANKGNIDKFNYLERNDQNRFLREESKKDNKHEFNCLMLKVPFKNWESVLSKIDKEDLYEEDGNNYGLEHESHVTVLYGLHEEVDENQLINFVKEHCSKPIEISISKMGVFKNSKFEVLKLDVDSQELKDLNKIICENFPYTSKFPDYNPHITIAYLKKGTSQKYLKDLKTPVTKSLDTFLYSKVNGSKKEFKI